MKTPFFNINIDILDHNEALDRCRSYLSMPGCRTVFFLNAHCFNVAQQNQDYARVINNADLLLNDGIGVKIGSALAGISVKENMNGTDFIPQVLALAAKEEQSVFFLGGYDGVAEAASRKIEELVPELKVVGFHSGYFSREQETYLIEKINKSGARILVLGMGVPLQELWAERNKARLENVKIVIGGGAILDFLSGAVSRAPQWVRKINMEWMYRFYLEPKRMRKRYTSGIFRYFFYLLKMFPERKNKLKDIS